MAREGSNLPMRRLISVCLPLTVALILAGAGRIRAQVSGQVGYAVLTAAAESRVPVGAALFSWTNAQGVLVSQAGVASTEPVRSGRIFVDEAGTRTSLVLVNPRHNP